MPLLKARCFSPVAAQQRLAEALRSQQHMVSPSERDSAVHQAAAVERALAVDAQQRTEAAWRERLAALQQQLAHQSAEAEALRGANEKLELAAHALNVGAGLLRAA